MKRKALLNQCKVRERSMREVRRLLSLEKNAFEMLLTVMSKTKRTLISQAGNCFKGFMSGEGKIGQSILATVLEQTAVWAYQRVHQVTYKDCKESDPENLEPAPNDIDFSQMRDGKTSIYLIIPPDYLSEYRAVLRVMIGFAMRELRSNFKESKKDPDYQKKPPVLFILDEFPQLAYMRPIEEALLYLAGYDVRFWFFVQDVSQLQLHYKDSWRTFFANTGTQCFFGVSDIATANLVSEMAGMTTVQHTTQTDGISGQTTLEDCPQYQPPQRLPPNYWNNSSTFVSTYRMLITPDEVMRMNENEQIVFMKGLKPILCDRPNYYEFGDLDQCCDGIEPPHDVDYM